MSIVQVKESSKIRISFKALDGDKMVNFLRYKRPNIKETKYSVNSIEIDHERLSASFRNKTPQNPR